MNMKLFNTRTRAVETVKPVHGEVGVYACGPTVYDYTHIGHLRKYTMDDVLVRMLRHEGFKVTFVENITDVGHLTSDGDTGEDKLEKGAKKYGKSAWDVAREFEDYFWKSMDAMGILRPDVSCRATDHIAEQLQLVQELEKKGHTYVIEGDGVYFDVSTFPNYGKMAGLNLEQQQAGARVEEVTGKRHPQDFALWKFERPGENRAMVWKSPWHERSFPGWHIECSAMSMKYLGEQFAIHTGGIDHIPVHHTNEIAQSEAATEKVPFVDIWVHHNFLHVEGQKMSKSLGNVFTIDDVIEKGFSPFALRLLFLTAHYRSELNFTWKNLEGAEKSYSKLISHYAAWEQTAAEHSDAPSESFGFSQKAQEFTESFFSHVRNDLSTPEAVAVVWEVVKSELATQEKKALIDEFDTVLGLQIAEAAQKSKDKKASEATDIPQHVEELLSERTDARVAKEWQKADALREKIAELGYVVHDLPDGSQRLERS